MIHNTCLQDMAVNKCLFDKLEKTNQVFLSLAFDVKVVQ